LQRSNGGKSPGINVEEDFSEAGESFRAIRESFRVGRECFRVTGEYFRGRDTVQRLLEVVQSPRVLCNGDTRSCNELADRANRFLQNIRKNLRFWIKASADAAPPNG